LFNQLSSSSKVTNAGQRHAALIYDVGEAIALQQTVSGRADGGQELLDLAAQAFAFIEQRERRAMDLAGGGTGFGRAAPDVLDTGRDLGGTLRSVLDVARDLLRCRALFLPTSRWTMRFPPSIRSYHRSP
jgi:hypothetical protein